LDRALGVAPEGLVGRSRRAAGEDLAEIRPAPGFAVAEGVGQQIQLIDPSPAKMMYFPVTNSPKEFSSMKKDLEKLLKLNHKGEKL